ncbi:uncharacterized protein BDV17DRAFT_268536 [Aspergillus undulatus]|uniref:uncharacterized protein n=1 Tax=Aspergillus undulatus TaxID=1810928 RepID=UPI003CCE0777
MMISPYQRRGGGGGPGTPRSPRTAVPTRGLLLDGIWRCNCPERPPALRLQTKNHGVNHGRWFYTCQKDHQSRCKFFLWASDAEAREKLALISNSRTEANGSSTSPSNTNTPQTPSSKTASAQQNSHTGTGLLTPQTNQQDRLRQTPANANAKASARARMMAEVTDEFEWDDSMEDEMEKVLENSQPLRQPEFGLPARKAPCTEKITNPGKRKRSVDDAEESARNAPMTPGGPARRIGVGGTGNGNPPFLTPTPARYKSAVAESPLASSSELAGQVSRILESHGVDVPLAVGVELRELFNRHEMKMKGIIRGRDISRDALRKKDEEIARLNEKIAMLEAQRELDRTVRGSR